MGRRRVLAISGSPSASSKSARLADEVLDRLQQANVETRHIRVRDLNPQALMNGDMDDNSISAFTEAVDGSHGLVLATPIYKAAYSGLLKAALDLLPQYALAGKVVLPLATGGTPAHILALDYALRPVLQSMGARHVVQSHFVAEAQFTTDPFGLTAAAELPLTSAIDHFLHSLTDLQEARWLGYPMPPVGADPRFDYVGRRAL
jgi:FMN reductase